MQEAARKINKALTCGLKIELNKLQLNKQMSKSFHYSQALSLAQSLHHLQQLAANLMFKSYQSQSRKQALISQSTQTHSLKHAKKLNTTITKESSPIDILVICEDHINTNDSGEIWKVLSHKTMHAITTHDYQQPSIQECIKTDPFLKNLKITRTLESQKRILGQQRQP